MTRHVVSDNDVTLCGALQANRRKNFTNNYNENNMAQL